MTHRLKTTDREEPFFGFSHCAKDKDIQLESELLTSQYSCLKVETYRAWIGTELNMKKPRKIAAGPWKLCFLRAQMPLCD